MSWRNTKSLRITYKTTHKHIRFEFYTGVGNIRFDGSFNAEQYPDIFKELDELISCGVSMKAQDYL